MKEQARYEILYEAMNGKLDAITEGVNALQDVPARLGRVEGRLENIEIDMKIIKRVIREHSADITELKSKSHLH